MITVPIWMLLVWLSALVAAYAVGRGSRDEANEREKQDAKG